MFSQDFVVDWSMSQHICAPRSQWSLICDMVSIEETHEIQEKRTIKLLDVRSGAQPTLTDHGLMPTICLLPKASRSSLDSCVFGYTTGHIQSNPYIYLPIKELAYGELIHQNYGRYC